MSDSKLGFWKILFPVILLTLTSNSCQEVNTDNTSFSYQVRKISSGQLQIDGRGGDALWEAATVLTDFQYPWRDEEPPATIFRALWDDARLYFLYRAADPDIIVKTEGEGERDVVNSDRVEIFFKKDDRMDPYYALELDALGRILDTEGRFYRKVDFDWNWPEGHLIVKASRDEEGYWVEGSITWSSLRDLGMYDGGDRLNAGLYRGEYVPTPDGQTEVKWISWVRPDSDTPDFHIPSSFGSFLLVE